MEAVQEPLVVFWLVEMVTQKRWDRVCFATCAVCVSQRLLEAIPVQPVGWAGDGLSRGSLGGHAGIGGSHGELDPTP